MPEIDNSEDWTTRIRTLVESEQREQARCRHEHLMERNQMPTYDIETGTTNTSAWASEWEWATSTTATATTTITTDDYAEPIAFPVFHLQQNTQAIELRALRDRYPTAMFDFDYQLPLRRALLSHRADVRTAIRGVERIKAARHALQNASPRFYPDIHSMVSAQYSSRVMRALEDFNTPIQQITAYRNAVAQIEEYRAIREQFLRDQPRYAPRLAEYNQQVAMIRQRPVVPVEINTQDLISVLIQWENVWGVAVHHNQYEEILKIRIGLCGIVMEESARESRYDTPMAIQLAPFYFTIKLTKDGRFVCSSSDNNVRGLSRFEPGCMMYDVHPHQLSDAPCFGTFGQTMIDMALQGDIISLVGTLIGFYSQYNSQDSAGVNAMHYHPERLDRIRDVDEYNDTLSNALTGWSEHYVYSAEKLITATQQYDDYHQTERTNGCGPCIVETMYCANCEDVNVGDGTDYYITAGGDRICHTCWHEEYCGDCENHNEDCQCNPEEW